MSNEVVAVSTGCSWFGPASEAPVRVVTTDERVIPGDPNSPLLKVETKVCPTCGSTCNLVDSDTFNRGVDGDPRLEFRAAREWGVGKHFPSLDELYEVYEKARSGADNPIKAAEVAPVPAAED